jgi:hypothetical protein
MRCPNCGKENAETSAFCFECGTRLKAEAVPDAVQPNPTEAAPAESAPAESAPAAPAPAEAPSGSSPSAGIAITHRGHVFGLGYGSDFYAVWDLRTAWEPVSRFDASPVGWEAAWRRFHELERVHSVPSWRRPELGWILLHVAIGLIGLGVLQAVVIGVVLSAAGKETAELTLAGEAGRFFAMLTGLTGWLSFVYLEKSRRVRWAVFLVLLAVGLAIALAIGLATQPAAG